MFSPAEKEVARAQQVIDAVRAAEGGSANLNGTMIDAATQRVFEVVLERAKRIGMS